MGTFDLLVVISSFFLSFYIRVGNFAEHYDEILTILVILPLVSIPIFYAYKFYKHIIRYINFRALWDIFQGVSIYSFLLVLIIFLFDFGNFPRSIVFINWALVIISIGSARIFASWIFKDSSKKVNLLSNNRVIIYGAGSAGIQLATALFYSNKFQPVGFVDDNISLNKTSILGLNVYHPNDLERIIERKLVDEIFLAIPSASKKRTKKIINSLSLMSIRVRSVPSIGNITSKNFSIDDLKIISINDLIGREIVEPNQHLLRANVSNKAVLVTGAGGTIGSEISRQVLSLGAKKIILFDISEYALYKISQELEKLNSKTVILPLLGDVIDTSKIFKICQKFRIETVYHAAAYKHVPLVEMNILAGLKNNIFGTLSCAKACLDAKVKSFVLISSDKAVNPTNFMGATKRLSEMIIQSLAFNSNMTSFAIVRFGNVLDSSGSVIPLFQKQISDGGPVTVTSPDIVRYFMTISEAAELVIQSGAMSNGGDIFLLEMGEPVKIFDLAKKMISLSGF